MNHLDLDFLQIPLKYFNQGQQRIFWFYLLTSFLVAWLACRYPKSEERPKASAVLSQILSKDIYLHKSAVNDYLFFFTNSILYAALIFPAFAFVSVNIANNLNTLLVIFFSEIHDKLDISRPVSLSVLTLLFFILSDFCIFLAHYLQHRIPWLWEFHKIHHSAEVMTPITVYRMHPVDDILTFSITGLVSGVFMGLYQFLFKSELTLLNIAGANILLLISYIGFYNLRHSHIWVGFGRFWSRIFISPAQHQIHHSDNPMHFDKNMGLILAIWDGWFGTLYVPQEKESLTFGIGSQENKKYRYFWSLYLMPFISLYKTKPHLSLNGLLSVLVFCCVVVGALYFSNSQQFKNIGQQTVFLEDMTWLEVKEAQHNGYDGILIPTGGTEQNGPHLVLGKHNFIVKYTAGQIAQELGHVLVAPVLSYVPEGELVPATEHMRFNGTITVSQPIFAQVLESAARSMKQHGFKWIAFIGDSGGNQESQAKIAAALTQEWAGEGVSVLQINDYYQNNGQISYLNNEGFNLEQIGSHAGIRDTSELMAVNPAGVRSTLLADNIAADYPTIGANGNANLASTALGNVLLKAKVDAAVNQLRRELSIR